jgi:putative transposase
MKRIARNLTDAFDGFLNGKRYLLMDRDSKFCPAFREILKTEDIKPVLLPPRSPNLNAHMERFHRSLKGECLNRMIFFGEKSLRDAVGTFLEHFHSERNHRGLNNRVIEPGEEISRRDGEVLCRERLGGLLRGKIADLLWNPSSSRLSRPALPSPVQLETHLVPAYDSLGLHYHQ